MRTTLLALGLVALLALSSTPAQADTATYEWEGYTTAEVGIAGLVTGRFVMTMKGDTADITESFPGIFTIPTPDVEIVFDGWGSVQIATPLFVVSDTNAGVGAPTNAALVAPFISSAPEWLTYELDAPITIFDPAPISGPFPLAIQGGSGNVIFGNPIQDLTFTAAVPEPASLALVTLGSLAIVYRRRRRKASNA